MEVLTKPETKENNVCPAIDDYGDRVSNGKTTRNKDKTTHLPALHDLCESQVPDVVVPAIQLTSCAK